MSNLRVAFGIGGSAANWYLTSTRSWFTPIDISRLPGPKPQINLVDAVTVTVNAPQGGWNNDLLYFGRVLADTSLDGTDYLDVVRFWNDVKNVQAIATTAEKLFFDGFVHVDVMVGTASLLGSHVTLNGAKRGNVITGAGDDVVTVAMVSNINLLNWVDDFRIATGAGKDIITIAGLDIAAEIASGDTTYLRSSDSPAPLIVSGHGRNVYIDSGAGDDVIIGFSSREHIIAGTDDGAVQLVTSQLPPDGFGYAIGGATSGGARSILYRIDLASGSTTAIGEVALQGPKGAIRNLDVESLALSPTDGFLYGFVKGSGNTQGLARIDAQTGAATLIADSLGKYSALQDMAFDLKGNLYLANDGNFVRVNSGSGAVTVLGNNTLSKKIGALAIDPDSGDAYGLAREGSSIVLSQVDLGTGNVIATRKIAGFSASAQIEGMSFDSAGKLWAVDRITGSIISIDLELGRATTVSTSLAVSKQTGEGFEALAIRVDADHILTGIKAVGGDVITGGAEADHFLYRRGDGVDTITDFELGIDGLHIVGYDPNQIRIQQFGGDTFIRFADASPDGFDDAALIRLVGVSGFSAADVILSDSGLFG